MIAQTILSQRRFSHIDDDLANKSIELDKLCGSLHKLSMVSRMVPLKSTFQKMNRIVRDTSKASKSRSSLSSLRRLRVIKIVLDKPHDLFVHIVRNAVDHGSETSAERISSGDEKGNIKIGAFHEATIS